MLIVEWVADIDGQEHQVRLERQVDMRSNLGECCKTKVLVDGEVALEKSGGPLAAGVWSNCRFTLLGHDAVIKFRAIKRMRGCSLWVDGRKIPATTDTKVSSAESVMALQVLAIVVLLGALVWVFIFR